MPHKPPRDIYAPSDIILDSMHGEWQKMINRI